jgi:hypothetical protein
MNYLKSKKNTEALVNLAINHYIDELQVNYLYRKKINFENNSKVNLDIINDDIIENLTSKSPFSQRIVTDKLSQNNPANFELIVCCKLLLCSSFVSYMWHIPYPCLYKMYYAYLKQKGDDIDVFIGILREMWDEGNEYDFEKFENLMTLKYKKLRLDII